MIFTRSNLIAVLIAGPVIVLSMLPATHSALLLVLPLVGVYFLPTIVAKSRGVPNQGSVLVINVFLGWTLVGWVVALAMAARSQLGQRDSLTR